MDHWNGVANGSDMNERVLAEQLLRFALAHTVAVGIAATEPTEDPNSFRSASGALVRISGVPLLITNRHVIQVYREFAAQRKTQFFFADVAFDLTERVYSESEDLDLAVVIADKLRIRTDRHAGVPAVELYEPEVWSPAMPRPGDKLVFAGWPEVARSVDILNLEATFQPYGYVGATINEVSRHNFTVQFDRSQFHGVTGAETRAQLEERNLSGLSGAPIFRYNAETRDQPDLVGFVKEYSCNWDLLIATSATSLRADCRLEGEL